MGTVAAYPLLARGQFLGVLDGVYPRPPGSSPSWRLLEELADLAALAADRDRLLSYSRSQEALAQTVVRQAPVAIAVLTGDEKTSRSLQSRLCRSPRGGARKTSAAAVWPTCYPPIALGRRRQPAPGRRLRERRAASDDRAADSPPGTWHDLLERDQLTALPAARSVSRGVLVAAVEVTRQVVARQRAQESAEMAQDRIGQMMTLHATSLAVAEPAGCRPARAAGRHPSPVDSSAECASRRRLRARTPVRGELEVIVCQGLTRRLCRRRIRVGGGLAGRVGQTGQG